MKRLALLIFLLMLGTWCFAGEYENALNNGKPVLLYVYAPYCGYCKKFDVIYYKLFQIYNKNYSFVRLNSETYYGASVLLRSGGSYVPYVVLKDSKKQKTKVVNPQCSLELACADRELKEFLK